MRKVDWHVMPRFLSLALLCSLDRGSTLMSLLLALYLGLPSE